MRIIVATLLAPIAVPVWFSVVLRFYAPEGTPLLPGMVGMILYAAYLVTIVGALPIWICLHRYRKAAFPLVLAAGLVIGLLAAVVAYRSIVPEWPKGLLMWSGALGGASTALVFQLIAGAYPAAGAGDRPQGGGWIM